jgi:hypothetical protein
LGTKSKHQWRVALSARKAADIVRVRLRLLRSGSFCRSGALRCGAIKKI